jgi:hypothetical protein
MFPELRELACFLARLIHCQRSEGDRPVHDCMMMMETILSFFFFYSILLLFFFFLPTSTAEKIRRSGNGTSKSEQRKCSACKYLNCTIHFFFFPALHFVSPSLISILEIHFFLPSRSKSSRVPQCLTRKCALKLAMQQILTNGSVMTLCISKKA